MLTDADGSSSDAEALAPTPRHTLAQRGDWPWLPTLDHGTLAPHPWCVECGRVAAVGSARALDLGGLLNLLGRLTERLRREGYKLTEAQRRLIVKRLEALEADDRFGLTREAQQRMVSEVVASHVRTQPAIVQSYVREC